MKIYLVGGAVRDEIMGIKSKDRDYVVVGSSEAEMLSLGFTKVGADFPVFLHPVTKEEYALARTEKKVGDGYHGFITETEGVTLEQDLSRRDFTMNSMAKDLETGEIIDPFNGREHIQKQLIVATSPASFQDDPLRVVRGIRFAIRYDFDIDEDTQNMIYQVVLAGTLDQITSERKVLELLKICGEKNFQKYFVGCVNVMQNNGILPAFFGTTFVKHYRKDVPAVRNVDPEHMLARLVWYITGNVIPKPLERVSTRVKWLVENADNIFQIANCQVGGGSLLRLIKQLRVLNNPKALNEIKSFYPLISWGMLPLDYFVSAVEMLEEIDYTSVVAGVESSKIPDAIHEARLSALQKFDSEYF